MRVAFGVAAAAAAIATAGDLLLLWVANALRPELGLALPPPGALRLGAVLGVVSIPMYALGYAAASARAEPALGPAARWTTVAGGLGAVLGCYIHAATAWLIEEDIRGAGPAAVGAPLDMVADAGPALTVPWAGATVLVLFASGAMAYAALRGAVPRSWLVANPAVATILLALAGTATELGRAFLVPAAPNVAHVVFFATALGTSGRRL
jgi:hypothetical protein